VSVVRQSHHSDVTGSDTDDSSPKGLFGRRKKKGKKKDDNTQTALVFSFSNADFSKNYGDLIQESLAGNSVPDSKVSSRFRTFLLSFFRCSHFQNDSFKINTVKGFKPLVP
jgi:hypothetical protein